MADTLEQVRINAERKKAKGIRLSAMEQQILSAPPELIERPKGDVTKTDIFDAFRTPGVSNPEGLVGELKRFFASDEVQANDLARETQKANATRPMPNMGDPRQEGRDVRLNEGDLPDSNRTAIPWPTAKQVPPQQDPVAAYIAAVNNGMVGYNQKFDPRMGYDDLKAELAGIKRKRVDLPSAEEAIRKMQEELPHVTRNNMDTTGVERTGWANLLAKMADNEGSVFKGAAQAYIDKSNAYQDKILGEQQTLQKQKRADMEALYNASRLDKETLNKMYGEDYADALVVLGQKVGFRGKENEAIDKKNQFYKEDAVGKLTAASHNTKMKAEAARIKAANEAKTAKEMAVERALNARGLSMFGAKGMQGASDDQIRALAMAIYGKTGKGDGDEEDEGFKELKKKLGQEKALAIVSDPANANLSYDQLIAKAMATGKVGQSK